MFFKKAKEIKLGVFPHFHGKLYEMQRTKHDEQIIAIEKKFIFFYWCEKEKRLSPILQFHRNYS
jgi:hypothetical protein